MVIGLDIGHRKIKLAVVDGSVKVPQLSLYAEKRIAFSDQPDQQLNNKIEAIRDLLSEHKLTGQSLHINVNASDCMIRVITVPFTQKSQIDETILFTAETYLHGIVVDDVLIDYHVIETLESSSKVLIVAIAKKKLKALIKVIELAGLEVPSIGLDCFSLFNTVHLLGLANEEDASLILDLGADTCKMLFVDAGVLKLFRSSKVGTFTATRSVAKTQRLTPENIEDMQEKADGANLQEIDASESQAAQYEYLEKVVGEVRRTALRVNTSIPLSTVYICGGGSLFAGAKEFLAKELGMTVRHLDLSEHIQIADAIDSETNANAGVAIGTALKALGGDIHKTDFRRDEFRYERRIEQLQKSLLIACILLFALFGIMAVETTKKITVAKELQEAIEDKQKKMWNATFGGNEETVATVESIFGSKMEFPGSKSVKKDLYEAFALIDGSTVPEGEQKTRISAVKMLRVFLEQLKGKYDKKFLIKSVRFQQKGASLVLEVPDQKVPYDITTEVNKSKELFLSQPRLDTVKGRQRASYDVTFLKVD